jgi:hypothetical protein
VTAVRKIIIEPSVAETTSNQREVLASLSENENNFFEVMITTVALFLCTRSSPLFAQLAGKETGTTTSDMGKKMKFHQMSIGGE